MHSSTQLAHSYKPEHPFSLGMYLADFTRGKEFDFVRITERGEPVLLGITYDDTWTDGTYLVRDGDTFHLRPLERIEPELRRANLHLVGRQPATPSVEILGRVFCRVRTY